MCGVCRRVSLSVVRDSLAAVYPPPDDSLAEATVRELDDQFFTSDPYAYIRSRITSLMTENAPASRGDISEGFIGSLVRPLLATAAWTSA